MKILIFSLNFAPEPTATGKYTGEMALWLDQRGHSVDVISGLPHYPYWKIFDGYGRKFRQTEDLGIRSKVTRIRHYVPSGNKIKGIHRIRMELSFLTSSFYEWLRMFLKRKQYDVIIHISPPLFVSIWPIIYSKIFKTPMVMHIQDLQVDAALKLGLVNGKIIEKTLNYMEKVILNSSTFISTITNMMARKIESKGIKQSKIFLFPNWTQKMSNTNSLIYDFRLDNGIGENEFFALYAGNLGEKQGLDQLLDAANLLPAGVKILIVGAGADRERLIIKSHNMGLKNVKFIDVQPLEKLMGMLKAANVHLVIQKETAEDLVMPSKLTNILASGRPCIVTCGEGSALHELITREEVGLTVPYDSPELLAKSIWKFYEDPRIGEEMGSKSSKYAEKWLDMDMIMESFEQNIIKIAGGIK